MMSLSFIYQTKIGRQKEIVCLLLHKGKWRCIYGLQNVFLTKAAILQDLLHCQQLRSLRFI
jgi:hypothetical protein